MNRLDEIRQRVVAQLEYVGHDVDVELAVRVVDQELVGVAAALHEVVRVGAAQLAGVKSSPSPAGGGVEHCRLAVALGAKVALTLHSLGDCAVPSRAGRTRKSRRSAHP